MTPEERQLHLAEAQAALEKQHAEINDQFREQAKKAYAEKQARLDGKLNPDSQ